MSNMNWIFRKIFSTNLREIMKDRRISVRELADAVGVRQTTVKAWLNREYEPRGETIRRIAEVLNCTTADLYDDDFPLQTANDSVWKPSKKYEDYELSVEGEIRNIHTGQILKTRINSKGYETVTLQKDKKPHSERVHRLMADAFMDDIPEGIDIYHENLNRADNRLENLKLSTKSETSKRGFTDGKRKGRGQIQVQCVDTGETFNSIRECANKLGLSTSQISKSINGSNSKAGGKRFKRLNPNT